MDHDRQDGASDDTDLPRILETLEDALAGLDRLERKVVAARLSLVIEEVRGLIG